MAFIADWCGFRRCYSGYRLERRLLAIGQLELGLCRLRHRRRRLHDRHAYSIGLDRAHHSCEGGGDGIRNRHGAHQFCGVGV